MSNKKRDTRRYRVRADTKGMLTRQKWRRDKPLLAQFPLQKRLHSQWSWRRTRPARRRAPTWCARRTASRKRAPRAQPPPRAGHSFGCTCGGRGAPLCRLRGPGSEQRPQRAPWLRLKRRTAGPLKYPLEEGEALPWPQEAPRTRMPTPCQGRPSESSRKEYHNKLCDKV